ncbi:MAG: 2-oxoacid:acceptor oxidoreductase family protein [Rhodospirillales bacterium]|jgi:pyruvate ferredoxin oxidoreductase gamma subunit/phenylglyoxylate dehydrogenase gamma subunit|nr:2-oxoacid:acceptor oxidoreductase family protein [Rhodospirillales bacterium]
MHEVRIHGRGGQGAVLASKILAKALVDDGSHATAIPSFGFERRGAPVTAFLRIDDKEIRTVTNIYNPDSIICIDPTISRAVDIFAGLKDQGIWVQATKKGPDEMEVPDKVGKLGLCDAVGIAREIFDRPITNSIMLGAFAKTSGLVSLEALKEGFRTTAFRDANLDQNMDAIERGYNETVIHQIN